jgi:hypothetical protein
MACDVGPDNLVFPQPVDGDVNPIFLHHLNARYSFELLCSWRIQRSGQTDHLVVASYVV